MSRCQLGSPNSSKKGGASPAVAKGVDIYDCVNKRGFAGEEPAVCRDASGYCDHGVSTEDGVRTRLANAGAGHRISAAETLALLAHHFAAARGFAEIVSACGKVEDDVDSVRGGERTWWHRCPEVFAYLNAKAKSSHFEDLWRFAARRGRKLPRFVVFAVGRETALPDDARHLAGENDCRGIVYRGAGLFGKADDRYGRKVGRRICEVGERLFGGVEKFVAEEKVAACIARDAQFREDNRRNARLGRLSGKPSHLFHICRGIS